MVELVPLEKKFLDIVTKWNYDPEVSLYFSKRPALSDKQQLQWLNNILKDSSKKKFIIIHQLSKEPIGMVSLMKIEKSYNSAEFGITIGEKSYWGSGAAKAASQMILQYALQILTLKKIYLRVYKANIRAIRFFSNLGFDISDTAASNENGEIVIEMHLNHIKFINQTASH